MIKNILGYVLALPLCCIVLSLLCTIWVTMGVCLGVSLCLNKVAQLSDITDSAVLSWIGEKLLSPMCDKIDNI